MSVVEVLRNWKKKMQKRKIMKLVLHSLMRKVAKFFFFVYFLVLIKNKVAGTETYLYRIHIYSIHTYTFFSIVTLSLIRSYKRKSCQLDDGQLLKTLPISEAENSDVCSSQDNPGEKEEASQWDSLSHARSLLLQDIKKGVLLKKTPFK